MSQIRTKPDTMLIFAVTLLLVIGGLLVFSASSFKAQEAYGDSHYFLKSHLYRIAIGVVLMLIVSQINYNVWLNLSPLLLATCILILVYMLFSDSVTAVRGSRRWLTLGFFTFQPSEFGRMSLILFLCLSLGTASYFAQKSPKSFLFHLAVITCVVVPIFFQPDVGSALLTAGIAVALLFLAGERLQHLFLLAITAVPFLLLYVLRDGYQKVRIMKYVAALEGQGLDWQAKQAFIALGNGGLFGLGLGGTKQKLDFLPDPFTDFIFAIVGEEGGLLSTTAVIVLFVIVVWSGLKIANECGSNAGRLLGAGVVLNIGVYAAANMAVVVSLLPTTGLPMPFMSYGGSALIVNLFGIGVLLNIADQNRNEHRLKPAGSYTFRRRTAR